MKKIKLTRKRKKLFKKENLPEPDLQYMSYRIINELAASDPGEWNPIINHRKFIRESVSYPNGQLKKVISYY